MNILVLNCGSSSLKFQLVDTSADRIAADNDVRLADGLISSIGLAQATVQYAAGPVSLKRQQDILDHQDALTTALSLLTEGEGAVVKSLSEIDAVGHRFVHGGEEFTGSVLITDDNIAGIQRCTELAPLHNPANLRGYELAKRAMPELPHAAIFDTSFHQTMPRRAYLYALPWSLYEKHKLRRYGFHGTSHRFVFRRAAMLLGKTPNSTNAITLHLGNGCSACAIRQGKSIDTSMGFTPLEGLVMGSRAGDLDPAAILHLMTKEEIGLYEATSLLNKFSGLAGLSGVSSDLRAVEAAADSGNDRARAALDVFAYRVRKYIGAYYAALDGEVDVLVLTGGIGEHAAPMRARMLTGLERLGLRFTADGNARPVAPKPLPSNIVLRPGEGEIGAPDSPTRLFVIPTDEERVIARDVVRLLSGHYTAGPSTWVEAE